MDTSRRARAQISCTSPKTLGSSGPGSAASSEHPPGGRPHFRIANASSTASARASTSSSVLYMANDARQVELRSEEHTSELQSLMRISYAVFCLKKKNEQK